MSLELTVKKDKWKIKGLNEIAKVENNNITINNKTSEKLEIEYGEKIVIKDKKVKQIKVDFSGEYKNAGGYLVFNDGITFPFNSTSIIDIKPPVELNIKVVLSAESMLSFGNIELKTLYEEENLTKSVSQEPDVLVITPNYPSLENLYYCAFAHSRNKEYQNSGLKIQVASISPANWFQTSYTHEGIPVIKGTYKDLKELLSRRQYKVIVTHFVDEYLYPIFDGYISNEKLIFICHGPETVFRYLLNVTRPYFTKPLPYPTQNEVMDIKESWVKRFSKKDNVEWVFVSDWLKDFSEKELGIKFKHTRVINNIINEELFPYKEKKEDDRCKILVIRKFDNIIQHSIDQVVLTILELSRRPFFDKLTFEIYGDGNYYDELVEPIRNFKNVQLHRTFVPNNQITKIHEDAGILLIPSRHDTQGVSMGEAESSGLVVVSSNITAIPFFVNEKYHNLLASPENYIELADIIERLYNNPKDFLEISKQLSEETRNNYGKKNTVQKEVELIKEKRQEYKFEKEKMNIIPSKNPILTIAIPAYNVEQYLEKCLDSILRADNIQDIEVLVVNDGSKDKTAEIAQKYEELTNGVVKVINKENGGHGSTINASIAAARGKYYRLVDGDDWVDNENLAKLVEILKKTDADIVLTKGSYEYKESAQLVDIIKYDNLREGQKYHFDDLIYKGYGFNTYGPLLTTGNYKLDVLRKANFKISEKRPYVDMEFNSFSLKYVETLEYYNLDIYRYLIGREGQTISRDAWKKKYKDHVYVLFNILEKVYKSTEYSECKKKYILNNIIAQMVDSQIFMFDCIQKWDEIDGFLKRLKEYPEAYKTSMDLIEERDGNCKLILQEYKNVIGNKKMTESIIIPTIRENVYDLEKHPIKTSAAKIISKRNLKRAIKFITPYGVLKLYRKRNRNYLKRRIFMSFFCKIKRFLRRIFVDYGEINRICENNYKALDDKIMVLTDKIESNSSCLQKEIVKTDKIKENIDFHTTEGKELLKKILNENLKISDEINSFRNEFSYTNTELLNIKREEELKNILIIGFYGAPNLGDELMLETILDYLDDINNKKITILLANNPEYSIDKYKDVRFIHYPKSLSDFNIMAEQYDYIIFGGGAIIDDRQYEKENSYQYDLGTMLIKLSLRAIAFKKKVICIALSATKDITNQEYLEKLKYIIKNATYFSVRDEYSKKHLIEKLGKDTENKIIKINDIVLSNKKILDNLLENKETKKIANIGIVSIANDNNLEKLEIIINDVKNYNSEIKINLIPFYEYKNIDTNFYKKVIEKNNYTNIEIEKMPENIEGIIDLYRKNDIIIGMRYHSILIAHALGIPCISICYDIHEHYPYKIKYLNEMFQKEQAISYKNLKENDILNKLTKNANNLTQDNNINKKILLEAIEEQKSIINKML